MKLNAPGNTTLVKYGIQNEESDLRAHVCIKVGRVYVYPTEAGKKIIATAKYKKRPAYQKGIITAMGYLVPPQDIHECQWVPIPNDWLVHPRLKITPFDSTSIKGDRAAQIVRGLIIQNKIPLFYGTAREISGKLLQVAGVDIQVTINIQVKCDYNGGHKELGGTGNLYLQVAECNPFKQYGNAA